MQRASCGRDPGLAGPDRFATLAQGVSEGPSSTREASGLRGAAVGTIIGQKLSQKQGKD